MIDPWESKQESQSELTGQMMDSASESQDSPKQPEVKSKQQMAKVATRQMQHQPTKVASRPQAIVNPMDGESLLQFNQANLVQGVIWAEILGKPKAKRGRR